MQQQGTTNILKEKDLTKNDSRPMLAMVGQLLKIYAEECIPTAAVVTFLVGIGLGWHFAAVCLCGWFFAALIVFPLFLLFSLWFLIFEAPSIWKLK